MAVPKNFVDLATAYEANEGTFVSIIGAVVDYMPPTSSKGTSYTLTFKVVDRRFLESGYGNQGLKLRFFRSQKELLPKVRENGDIVLIRDIKITDFLQQPVGLSNNQTAVTVFPVASIPEPGFQIAYQGDQRIHCLGMAFDTRELSLEEQAYVIHLKQDLKSHIQSLPKNNVVSKVANGNTPPANAPTGPAALMPKNTVISKSAEGNAPPANAPTGPAALRKRPGDDFTPDGPFKRSKPSHQSQFGPRFQLIHELEHYKFADICVLVVKKFPSRYGCELYVTDYTENKEMFFYSPPDEETERERDGDAFDTFGHIGPSKKGWPGPYGWLVLKVDLQDPHAYYANKTVKEGDFVLLQNVKMKLRDHLEGNMWPDTLNPEKVQVRKLKDLQIPEIEAIRERKERYWGARKAKETPPITKTEKKKKKKEERKRIAEREAAAAEGTTKIDEAMRDVHIGALNGASKRDAVNPHIRCSHQEVPGLTIRNILDPDNTRHTNTSPEGNEYVMPFTCAKYRAKVRVVDFSPRILEDFAVPELRNDGNDDDRSISSPIMDDDSSQRFEWSFSLLLEDAGRQKSAVDEENRVWVNVGHQDAQHLFGNDVDDPVNLHSDGRLLAKLREKLCILWGNLEEKQESEQISNVPFECCLFEYGVELDDDDPEKAASLFDMKRMYGMFGVTIL